MPPRAIIAALIVACCWGGNFSATKLALADFPPFLLLTLRFALVSVLLAPFMLRRKLRPRMRHMLWIAITLIILQFSLAFTAMRLGLSVTSTIIATQMGVPFACLLSAVLYKDFLGRWRSVGLLIAMLGVVMVAGTPNAAEHWVAFLLAILGALAWSVANISMHRMQSTPVRELLFWPALLSVPILAALSAVFEGQHWRLLQQAQLTSWLGVAYSALFASLLGYGLWNWLVKRFPLSQVAPYSLLVPVTGITASAWMFHEPLTAQTLLGAGLTIAGVAIIATRRPNLVEPETL